MRRRGIWQAVYGHTDYGQALVPDPAAAADRGVRVRVFRGAVAEAAVALADLDRGGVQRDFVVHPAVWDAREVGNGAGAANRSGDRGSRSDNAENGRSGGGESHAFDDEPVVYVGEFWRSEGPSAQAESVSDLSARGRRGVF